MNSFRVDELISSLDDLKPFSDLLFEEAQTRRFHKIYKNLDKYEDSSLVQHLLVLVSFMEHSLQSDPSHIKPLQNYLIELTSVIEKAKSTVSNDHISIAMGILFKHSATLLDIQNGTDTAISVMLHSLAYQHLSSVSPKNAEVSAWIALHLLETAAAITNTELSQKEVAISLNRDDLAEYCVDCLISAEGGIQRLHAGVYREGIRNFPIILPNITAKHIEPLLNRLIPFLHRPEVLRMIVWMIGHNNVFRKMTIFDNVLSKSSIGRNVDFVGSNLTSTDVKVFLLTLALWSGSCSSSVKVPARLRIRADQLNCWKAICQLINNSSNGNLKWIVLRTRVIDSVRLRYRVINLTRLYEVFCWLEANDGNEFWMTLYATAINDAINVENTYRRKCDELFPDGFYDEKELLVADVDMIEEHASRYLAGNFLSKRQYREAAHRLMSVKSMCGKKLLLEVYQRWLRDGQPNEQERDQFSKWVRELQAECCESERDSHETTPTPSPVSFESDVDRDAVLTHSRRLQVDASTNTPSRTDVSSPSYDAEESFFSVRSDRTDDAASEHSFASATASPFGQNAASKVSHQKPRITSAEITDANEPKNRGSLSLGHPRGETTQNVLSITNSQSISVFIPGEHQEKSKELALPELERHSPSVQPKPAQTSPAVVTSISASPGRTTVSTATTSTATLPPIVANSPFGKFITNKEAATSFWKSGKPVAPVFGAVPPCIASSQQKPEQKSPMSAATTPASLTPRSVLKAAESSSIPAPIGTTGTDMSSFSNGSHKNIEGTSNFVQSSLTPRSSHKPQWNYFTSPHPDLSSMEESPIDDENFYNSLVIEMCKKQLERGPIKSQSTSIDIGALQEKMAQITVQLRNAENRLNSSAKSVVDKTKLFRPLSTSPSTVSRTEPTEAELLREKQRIALAELEQKVTQLLRPPTQPVMSAISTAHSPLKATEGITGPSPASSSCADTLAAFNTLFPKNTTLKPTDIKKSSTYAASSSSVTKNAAPLQPSAQLILGPLQKMEQLARHPGSDGLCFGCLDDEAQDSALRALDKLSLEWNTEGDSDSE